MMRPALFAAAALLALLAARDDPLAGRTAGAPVDCMDLRSGVGPDVVDPRTILYRESSRRVWRAEIAEGSCPSLRPLTTLIVEVHGTQLCRGDRFRTIDGGDVVPGPYCRFGRFTPYLRVR